MGQNFEGMLTCCSVSIRVANCVVVAGKATLLVQSCRGTAMLQSRGHQHSFRSGDTSSPRFLRMGRRRRSASTPTGCRTKNLRAPNRSEPRTRQPVHPSHKHLERVKNPGMPHTVIQPTRRQRTHLTSVSEHSCRSTRRSFEDHSRLKSSQSEARR